MSQIRAPCHLPTCSAVETLKINRLFIRPGRCSSYCRAVQARRDNLGRADGGLERNHKVPVGRGVSLSLSGAGHPAGRGHRPGCGLTHEAAAPRRAKPLRQPNQTLRRPVSVHRSPVATGDHLWPQCGKLLYRAMSRRPVERIGRGWARDPRPARNGAEPALKIDRQAGVAGQQQPVPGVEKGDVARCMARRRHAHPAFKPDLGQVIWQRVQVAQGLTRRHAHELGEPPVEPTDGRVGLGVGHRAAQKRQLEAAGVDRHSPVLR